MDNETQELQEILERSPNAIRSVDARENTQPSSSVSEKAQGIGFASDYEQWVILPNGRFAAAGATRAHLPVGAYTLQQTEAGLRFEAKTILTDTLIDLGNSNSLRVIEGIKLFWKRRQKFLDRGILFKRGVLMWGPPGSGKTATLALLIQDLIRQGGIVLLVQHPGVAIEGLKQLRKIELERPLIVVLEDVEEIIHSFNEHDLLALLDGEHQTDNVVNIATTNYPEMLGARIINRPSRFDEVIKIGMPSPQMRYQYLLHILGEDESQCDLAKWVEETEGMSIAHLKELVVAVMCLEQTYEEVIKRLKTMKSIPRSTMYDEGIGFGGLNGAKQLEAAGRPAVHR